MLVVSKFCNVRSTQLSKTENMHKSIRNICNLVYEFECLKSNNERSSLNIYENTEDTKLPLEIFNKIKSLDKKMQVLACLTIYISYKDEEPENLDQVNNFMRSLFELMPDGKDFTIFSEEREKYFLKIMSEDKYNSKSILRIIIDESLENNKEISKFYYDKYKNANFNIRDTWDYEDNIKQIIRFMNMGNFTPKDLYQISYDIFGTFSKSNTSSKESIKLIVDELKKIIASKIADNRLDNESTINLFNYLVNVDNPQQELTIGFIDLYKSKLNLDFKAYIENKYISCEPLTSKFVDEIFINLEQRLKIKLGEKKYQKITKIQNANMQNPQKNNSGLLTSNKNVNLKATSGNIISLKSRNKSENDFSQKRNQERNLGLIKDVESEMEDKENQPNQINKIRLTPEAQSNMANNEKQSKQHRIVKEAIKKEANKTPQTENQGKGSGFRNSSSRNKMR